MAELVFVQQLCADHGGTLLQEKVKNVLRHNQELVVTMAIWNNLAP
jgi:hypothetical protein